MSKQKKAKLALIDSHALIHRAYHALPPMTTREGQPTNAVFGFTTMLLKMFSTLKPTHVVAAFDVAGPTFRHKEFKDYKAHRGVIDDDLVVQFDVVRKVLQAFNIPVIEQQGFEADDVLGTLVTKLDSEAKKIIVTGDMDTLQLIDDDTFVFTLKRGISDTVLYDEEMVKEKYGFGPELVTDYKGLRGDPSDNIPGVAGIGEKTAKDLVREYGSIEEIYKHLDELPKRALTRLKGHKKEALLSRKLATIKRDMKFKFELADAELADYNPEAVYRLFEELEFKSLLQRIPKSRWGGVQATLLKKVDSKDESLPKNYHLVESPAEQQKLREQLLKEKIIAFDTETDGLGARTAPILGMSFAVQRGETIEAWYVPVTPETLPEWQELLESPAVGKIGHNLKYDLEVARQSGVELGPIAFDTMIASYLLHPGARQHGLDTLAVQELGHHCIPITSLIGEGKDQKRMSEVPLKPLARYACEDADIAWQLYEKLAPQIKDEGLTRVLQELELPLIPVLAHLELAGVKVAVADLVALEKKVSRRITHLAKKIWQEAGEEFNINSTQQLRVVLYEKLRLPTEGITRTQSGFSTAAAELAKLHGRHAIVALLEEYRELAKLNSTYITTLPKLADPTTKRIYAQFNQAVAATGRLSSAEPNLQNIPVRTELGQEIRAAFVAERGKRLIKADYSQLELRIAAHISQDDKMMEAFRAGEDIHRATAAWVHGVTLDKVTDKQRREAKTLNFGVLYGMGPINFARAADISVEEARSFVERYHEQYAGLTKLQEETIEQAENLGFVETLFGRRRYVPEINSNAPGIRAAAERVAFNFPIQGTAADILKKAMVDLYALMQKSYPEVLMVLTVHDELVCEVPINQVDTFAVKMKALMEQALLLDVPSVVEVATGANWRDLKSVKPVGR